MSAAAVTVGQVLAPELLAPVDAEKMKLMAAILRDPNAIHYDPAAVAAAGLGDRVINQGPATMSYLADYVGRWAGGADAILQLDARMLANVYAGDRVECSGEVTAVDAAAGTAEVALRAAVGERAVVTATAVVTLPRAAASSSAR